MRNITKILVVEDETIVSLEIQERLTDLGYEVCGSALSGEEAIKISEETHPNLVLMDIMLKGKMDGVEAAEQIRSRLDIPIVYLTAHSDEATLQRAKITGPFGYLLKPFDERSLHTTIEMALYRHDMVQRLKNSERWFATTLRSIGDAVIATDAIGCVLFMNPVAEKLTGWTQEEALHKDLKEIFNIIHKEKRSPVENPVKRVLTEGLILDLADHTILIAKDGTEIQIDDSVAPIRDENDNIVGVVLTFRDITERKKLEEQFHQAQKMESIGMLAGGVAHDFNNVLGGILGYASYMKMIMTNDHPFFKYIDIIEKSAKRGAELTAQLLSFARGEQYNIKSLNLNTIVKETLKIIRRTFDKGIKIDTFFADDLPTIDADEGQIMQLIMNLCVNARDAMPNGGGLILETSTTELNAPYIESPWEVQSGYYVKLSIIDTGIGMNKETTQKIFEPFYTTKEKGKGTGLGLSMVYSVVKNHGGYIRVYSELGEGSVFKIYLPVSGKPEEISQSLAETTMGGDEVVLMVDDEDSIRSFVKDCLENSGYQVLLAVDGEEAIEIYKQNKKEINLVILDMIMPKLSGYQTFLKLKELNPNIKTILSTGYSQYGKIKEILDCGINDFLQKPYQVHDLLTTMRNVLDNNNKIKVDTLKNVKA